jgi:pimeloyl-ACP methyl ester carboxylesterase
VFVNPGGPGGSGVQFVKSGFGEFLAEALNGRFDVVGFDPRGVGASAPLHCFPSQRRLNRFFAGLPLFPYRKLQYRPFFNKYRSLHARCTDDNQRIVRHMSTADVVRDLDYLRRAVGDRRLSYLGFSYGSYIGNTYANMFPQRVRALVIDGVLDPRLWSSGRQVVSDRVATEEEFDEFLRLCDKAGGSCQFHTPRGAEARWAALRASVREKPLNLDGMRYTYDLLIADATSAMYVPEIWAGREGFAAFLDLLADAALDGASTTRAASRVRGSLLERLKTHEGDYPNGLDSYFGNHCADAQYPKRLARFRSIGRFAARGSEFGPYWWWSAAGCAAWPVAADRYEGPWRTRTSNPVLVVGNYFDGVTDYAGARASSRLLRGSRLLSYAGWGHTAYGRSACVAARVNDYLLTRRLPRRGEVCPAPPNPFLTPPTSRKGDTTPLVGLPPNWPLVTQSGRGHRS